MPKKRQNPNKVKRRIPAVKGAKARTKAGGIVEVVLPQREKIVVKKRRDRKRERELEGQIALLRQTARTFRPNVLPTDMSKYGGYTGLTEGYGITKDKDKALDDRLNRMDKKLDNIEKRQNNPSVDLKPTKIVKPIATQTTTTAQPIATQTEATRPPPTQTTFQIATTAGRLPAPPPRSAFEDRAVREQRTRSALEGTAVREQPPATRTPPVQQRTQRRRKAPPIATQTDPTQSIQVQTDKPNPIVDAARGAVKVISQELERRSSKFKDEQQAEKQGARAIFGGATETISQELQRRNRNFRNTAQAEKEGARAILSGVKSLNERRIEDEKILQRERGAIAIQSAIRRRQAQKRKKDIEDEKQLQERFEIALARRTPAKELEGATRIQANVRRRQAQKRLKPRDNLGERAKQLAQSREKREKERVVGGVISDIIGRTEQSIEAKERAQQLKQEWQKERQQEGTIQEAVGAGVFEEVVAPIPIKAEKGELEGLEVAKRVERKRQDKKAKQRIQRQRRVKQDQLKEQAEIIERNLAHSRRVEEIRAARQQEAKREEELQEALLRQQED